MSKEYIERDCLIDMISERNRNTCNGKMSCIQMKRMVESIPTADVDPVQKWISVKDRLPEEKVNCIVHYRHAYCDNDGYWAIGFCFYDGEKFQFDSAYKVTHWIPLPQPPDEYDLLYVEEKE